MSEVNLNFLGDNGKNDILGIKNGFRKLTELYIKNLVENEKWFTICHKIDPKQEDIMQITNSEGVKLGSTIQAIFEEGTYRTSIYKYLLMNFLCYIEVPATSFKTDTGGFKQSFNKILATANVDVMAHWLGIPVEQVPVKYADRVFDINMDDGEDLLPYVKLVEGKDGARKISVPRMNIDVSERGTRVIPLFMLKSGVDALYDKMKNNIIKVSFLKDGGQVRDMFTTVDFSKINDIYGKGSFLDDSINESYNGDFLENRYLSKGYIKVPEVGGSRYDGPTRSMSYSRIVDISFTEKPDLSFINIDLSTVADGFADGVLAHSSQASAIVDMLEAFGIDGNAWTSSVEVKRKFMVKDTSSLLQWVEERSLLYSTVFTRELCLFMLANPQWFGNFTGKPKNRYSTDGDIGIF